MNRLPMMFAVVATVLSSSMANAAPPKSSATAGKTLEFGKKFEAELEGEKKRVQATGVTYTYELPIMLKAGQGLVISASVVGKGRTVAVVLFDPTGRLAEHTKLEVKASTLTIKEVNTKGRYTIVVASDQIGPFTVRATEDSDDLDLKALEEKRDQLKQELAEVDAKLKTLKEKSKQ